jgi:hypothetical protein
VSLLRAGVEPPAEWHGAAAARALMERVIAEHPVGLMVVWECRRPDDFAAFDAAAVPPSVAMMRAAARRGHAVWAMRRESLRWRDGVVSAEALRIEVSDDDDAWFAPRESVVTALTVFVLAKVWLK